MPGDIAKTVKSHGMCSYTHTRGLFALSWLDKSESGASICYREPVVEMSIERGNSAPLPGKLSVTSMIIP